MIKLGVDSSLMMVIKSGVGVAADDHFDDDDDDNDDLCEDED